MLLNQNDLEGQTPQPIASCTAIPNTDERHRGRWQREILGGGVSSRSRSVLLAIWPSWRPRRRERPAGPAASLHRPANRRAHVTEGLGSSRRRPGLRYCTDDVGRVGVGDWQPDARRERHFNYRPGLRALPASAPTGAARPASWHWPAKSTRARERQRSAGHAAAHAALSKTAWAARGGGKEGVVAPAESAGGQRRGGD